MSSGSSRLPTVTSRTTLIGSSPRMQALRTLLTRVALSPASTVLITGESGTGKDLAARYIHRESARRDQTFLTITCTALQESLLDSELFGHERGSFTDAKTQKRGLLELAHGGTVFLDEVGEMSPGLQAKLLRFLEDHTFVRVGGGQEVHVDVRVVAATNRDLAAEVRAGRFRQDLYFRLRVLPVEMPPLRERDGDVPLLVDYFLRGWAGQDGARSWQVTARALDRLSDHDWPGNVRELRNAVERAVLLSDSKVLGPDAFAMESSQRPATRPPLYVVGGRDGLSPQRSAVHGSIVTIGTSEAPSGRLLELPPDGLDIAALETDLVLQALERTAGNQAVAAELLGMTRDQVRYRVAKLRDVGALGRN